MSIFLFGPSKLMGTLGYLVLLLLSWNGHDCFNLPIQWPIHGVE